LRAICAKCTLGENAEGGNLSYDTMQDGTVAKVADVVPNHPTFATFDPGEIDETEPEIDEATRTRDTQTTLLACVAALPFDAIIPIAKVLAALTREEFEIVAHLLNGGTMIAYARNREITKQTAFARIKALFGKYPVFRAIANGGLLRGKGGRVAMPPVNEQMDFFVALEGC